MRFKRWLPTIAVLAIAVALRGYVYAYLAPGAVPPPDGYGASLRNHLGEYIWSNTLLPPLSYLLHSVPIHLFGVAGNAIHHGYFLLNAALGAAATLCVYLALARAQVPAIIRVLYSILFTVALIPFELWRANHPLDHYDHHTVALTACLAYAVVRLAATPDTRSALIAGGAGALLMFQSAAGGYIAPLTLLVIGVVVWRRRLSPAPRFAAALVLVPLAAFTLLAARNTAVGAAGSARGGAALMMFVQAAVDDDPGRARQLAVDSGAPDWYLWCYDNPRPLVAPGHPSHARWLQLSRAFGLCVPSSGPAGVAGVPWPFRYEELIERLRAFHQDGLVRIVEADQRDAYHRQYLLQGPSPELTPRWTAAYGAVSTRVATHLLRTQPGLYVASAWTLHQELFWGGGPDFLGRVADDLRTQEYPFRRPLFFLNRLASSALIRAAYVTLPLALGVWVVLAFRNRRSGRADPPALSDVRFAQYVGLTCPVFASAVLYSAAVSLENDRYFVQIVPPLIVAGGLIAADLARLLNRSSRDDRAPSRFRRMLPAAAVVTLAFGLGTTLRAEDPLCRVTWWWDSGWTYRQRLILDVTVAERDLTGFPLFISKGPDDATFWAEVHEGGRDVRFTDCTGTLLPTEIEQFDRSRQSMAAWVRVPRISRSGQRCLFLYYGNAGAGEPPSSTGLWDDAYGAVLHMRLDPSGNWVPNSAGSPARVVGASDGARQVDGQVGPAVTFDGSTWLELPDAASLSVGAGDWTVEAWLKSDRVAGPNWGLFSHGSADTWHVYHHGGNFWVVELRNEKAAAERSFTGSGASLQPDAWSYLAVVRSGPQVKLFVNGKTVGEPLDVGALSIKDAAESFLIGKGQYGTIIGTLDEFRVSKGVARSPEWLSATYLSGIKGLVLQESTERRSGRW